MTRLIDRPMTNDIYFLIIASSFSIYCCRIDFHQLLNDQDENF